MKSFLLLTFCFVSFFVYGQAPALVWAKSMGNTSGEGRAFITVDVAGNVYSTGNFSGTFDFDLGPGTSTLTAYRSNKAYQTSGLIVSTSTKTYFI